MTNTTGFAVLTADIICNLPTTAHYPKKTIAISLAGLPGVVMDIIFRVGIEDLISIASTLHNISSPLPFGSSYERYLAEKSHGIWKIRTDTNVNSNIVNNDFNIDDYTSLCTDVYKLLCANYVDDIQNKNAKELRLYYMSNQPDDGALLQDYIEIPYQLHKLNRYGGVTFNSKNANILKRIFRVWKMNLFLNTGVAEEFGLMALIIFRINMSKSYHKMCALHIKGMLNRIFTYSKHLYELCIQSCFLSILITNDEYYSDFITSCVVGGITKGQTSIQQNVWKYIETKAGKSHSTDDDMETQTSYNNTDESESSATDSNDNDESDRDAESDSNDSINEDGDEEINAFDPSYGNSRYDRYKQGRHRVPVYDDDGDTILTGGANDKSSVAELDDAIIQYLGNENEVNDHMYGEQTRKSVEKFLYNAVSVGADITHAKLKISEYVCKSLTYIVAYHVFQATEDGMLEKMLKRVTALKKHVSPVLDKNVWTVKTENEVLQSHIDREFERMKEKQLIPNTSSNDRKLLYSYYPFINVPIYVHKA